MKQWRKFFALALVASSFGALVLGRFPGNLAAVRPLDAADRTDLSPFGSSPWISDGIVTPDHPALLSKIQLRVSWIGGDAYTGQHLTGWYAAAPGTTVLVAGYPQSAPNRLEIEVRRKDGASTVISFDGKNPGSRWVAWKPILPEGATSLRVRATDATIAWGGWLGFSEPFVTTLGQTINLARIAQTFCTVALVFAVIVGPGMVAPSPSQRLWGVVWRGPLFLALSGALCWVMGGIVPPSRIAVACVLLILTAVSVTACRRRIWTSWTELEVRVLTLALLCVLGASARSTFSGGPEGELYAGTISRTLEVGGRSDSRISYHNVQLVAHHLSPRDPAAANLFSPWSYFSRGPLAGLAAASVVLGTGGRPPIGRPNHSWAPADRLGFAAYRITMIGLGALALFAVAALLSRLAGESRAMLGIGLLALAPFFWHELYFTWPKLVAAAWVLGSFHSVLERKPGQGALWLGGSYLWHPLALLSAPFLAGWLLVSGPRRLLRRTVDAALLTVGTVLIVGGWQLAGGTSQAGFLQYFRSADGVYNVTAGAWWASRWANIVNTLLPFHVLSIAAHHPEYNAFGSHSDGWVHFFLQYWTSAPFAVGFITWCALLVPFLVALSRKPAVGVTTLVAPFLFFTAYWGFAVTGIMREGGHVLFLSGWVFLVWAASDRIPSWVFQPWFSALRVIELLLLLFAPAFVSGNWGDLWLMNDLFWLGVTAVCVGGVAFLSIPANKGV